jgi:hypothetical protein
VQRWSPANGSLRDCVSRASLDEYDREVPPLDQAGDADDYALALSGVPDGLAVPFGSPPGTMDYAAVETICREHDRAVRRYLAAKLFGCWWPYLGLDLAGVLSAVQLHAAVLRVRLGTRIAQGDRGRMALLEAIRETDLLMVHLADAAELTKRIRVRS